MEGNTDICGWTYSKGDNKLKNPSIIFVSSSMSSLKNNIGISNIIYLKIFMTSSSVKLEKLGKGKYFEYYS